MKKATVRDLRYRFPEIEELLGEGDEVQITKRKRVVARLLPAERPSPVVRPDFLARLRKLYPKGPVKISGAERLDEERDRY